MKVISGIYGSRYLKSKEGLSTRPTMDKIKQALFNIIGSKIIDCVFLDLFSGSGQIGIEAISRGAKKVIFDDKDYEAHKIILENINSLKIESNLYILYKLDYKKALDLIDEKIDIVFLDPPYKKKEIYSYCFNTLIDKNIINKDGIIILEADNNLEEFNHEKFTSKIYNYGNKKLIVYKLIS